MNPTLAFSDVNPAAGSEGSPSTGDLSAVITANSLTCILRFTNTSDTPLALYYRTPGQTEYSRLEINPSASMERYLSLTTARTVEYYFDTGTISCKVIDFFGTGLTPAGITVNDIAAWLVMHGYTVGDGANLETAEVQLCLNYINSRVTTAANQFARTAMYSLPDTDKNDVTLIGTVARALYVLRNVGATRGLTSDMVIISNETADRYYAEYKEMIDNLNSGINKGT